MLRPLLALAAVVSLILAALAAADVAIALNTPAPGRDIATWAQLWAGAAEFGGFAGFGLIAAGLARGLFLLQRILERLDAGRTAPNGAD